MRFKGAISIFMIIIIIGTMTFGGVIIDMSRVLIAKNRIRSASETAMRSALADCNDTLVSEFGLFAVVST